MGAALADASRAAHDVFDEVDEALGQNLFRLMREGPDDELRLTENAQPAIMAHSIAVLRTLGASLPKVGRLRRRPQSWRIFGAVRGGLVRFHEHRQAAAVAGPGDAEAVPVGEGAMAALLGVDLALAQKIADAAARAKSALSPTTMTLPRSLFRATSGHRPGDCDGQGHGRQARGPAAGLGSVSLPADAIGSRSNGGCAELCGGSTPAVPLFANVTAEPATDPDTIRNQLVEQVTGMVRWRESVANMFDAGVQEFVEIGGKVLGSMVKRIVPTQGSRASSRSRTSKRWPRKSLEECST